MTKFLFIALSAIFCSYETQTSTNVMQKGGNNSPNIKTSSINNMEVRESLKKVQSLVDQATKTRRDKSLTKVPRLVAVSKTKPVDLIIEAYNEGQRHFGENYIQELVAKATDPKILDKCHEIKWHFIGHLQSNKVNKIIGLPNLYMIETVHSEKLARLLNTTMAKHDATQKLKVFVQINTSSEDEKNGIDPDDSISLCKYVIDECPNLDFRGIMTIGKYGYDPTEGDNPDYVTLINVRKSLARELNSNEDDIELSMGMSNDFVHAIELGSSNVRVGSSIFGNREKKG